MTYPCPFCNGTGRDEKKTKVMLKREGVTARGSYIRCWNCNGNGLDPAAYFNWRSSKDKPH